MAEAGPRAGEDLSIDQQLAERFARPRLQALAHGGDTRSATAPQWERTD